MKETTRSGSPEPIARNPVTGAESARVPAMEASEVEALVERAAAAAADWSAAPVPSRMSALRRLRRMVADRADEIVEVIREDTGKPAGEAMGAEVLMACEHLAHLIRHAPKVLRPRKAETGFLLHRRARVAYEPYGVVGAITPWNYPFAISMGVVATALATGNAVVLKPSEYTPRVGRRVGDLAAGALGRSDLVGVAIGDGSTGAALVAAGVDKIAFTGSVATGRKVMAAAAESLTPVVLELGGKDAMIVCEDADIERAARGAVWAAFYGCGQVCQSVERVYVIEPAYEEFVRAAVAETRRVRTSDEAEAMIGPLITRGQREIVERHLREATERGARVLVGGRRIEGLENFFQPTVVVGVESDMDLMTEETFGPVLPIMPVSGEEEAIELANSTRYGLDASVWSDDRARARRIADRLVAGTVLINDHLINYGMPDVPFGGARHSGFGRVHGIEGIREFVRPRARVEDRFRFAREPHWFREGGSGLELARALLDFRHGRTLPRRLSGAVRCLRKLWP